MSATRCKILICLNKSKMLSGVSESLVNDIESDPICTKRIIEIQEKYVEAMEQAMEVLTRG